MAPAEHVDSATHSNKPPPMLVRLVEAPAFKGVITTLIVISAILLGIETIDALPGFWVHAIQVANRAIVWVFVVELVLRIAAHRLGFFRGGWNLFDFSVVALTFLPSQGPLQVLRALRVMRVGRLLSSVPSLRHVVEGLLRAVPGLGSVTLLLTLILYIGAVMATHLFGDVSPERFGSIGLSLLTLFQVMTLENWPDVMEPLEAVKPYAWVYFVVFILLTSFMMLNLFVGVLVNGIQSNIESDTGAGLDANRKQIGEVMHELAALREEIRRHYPLVSPAALAEAGEDAGAGEPPGRAARE